MLSARELMRTLLEIEIARGRARPFWGAARTLDLDLVCYGNERISAEGLQVPHPRFRERLFVLEPLAELEPGWIDPATGSTISALLRAQRARSQTS